MKSTIKVGDVFGKLTVIARAEQEGGVYWELQCECGRVVVRPSKYLTTKTNPVRHCGCGKRASNKVGQKFGKLLVIEQAENGNRGRTQWVCECACGNVVVRADKALTKKTKPTRHCGCMSDPARRIGQRYGKLVVLDFAERSKSGILRFKCKCDCGSTVIRTLTDLIRKLNPSTHCGCMSKINHKEGNRKAGERRYKPLEVGQQFTYWTVLGEAPNSKSGDRRSLVECKCGSIRDVNNGDLRSGMSRSCGCYQKEAAVKAKTIHGKCGTAAYANFLSCMRRARKAQATPKWHEELTELVFEEAIEKAKFLETETGIKWHVDHIVPLRGKKDGDHIVSGLHVYNNFQVITAEENLRKNCHEWPDMP